MGWQEFNLDGSLRAIGLVVKSHFPENEIFICINYRYYT